MSRLRRYQIFWNLVGLLMAAMAVSGFLNSKRGQGYSAPAWTTQLEQRIKTIDSLTSGNLGVYVKMAGVPGEMSYSADRTWYLASTIKVLVAIAVLQAVEEGKLVLNQQLTLKQSDAVDGSGEVRFKKPGSRLKVSYLLEKMLTQSDSTATDMLIRLLGEDRLNHRIRTWTGGFQPVTTILEVRKRAYGFLHPNARDLTNHHFIALKKFKSSQAKYRAVARQMQMTVDDLQEKSIEDAFEKYYRTGLNSGSLRAFGKLLEKLVAGELLSSQHTQLLLRHMSSMTTGENRIKAGLPRGVQFAQKTGTQVGRICNVGIVLRTPATQAHLIVTA